MKIAEHGPSEGIYNLASGSALTVKKAIKAMLDSTNKSLEDSKFEKGNSPVPRIVANVQKIKNKYPDLQLDWHYMKSTTT